jgi:hypothetical protein
VKITIIIAMVQALAFTAFAEPSQEAKSDHGHRILSDFEIVRNAEVFSIGGIGIAASIAPAETSFRRILETPTASQDCRRLTTQGTKAGQLYGLLGLKLLKDPAYPLTAARYKSSRGEVQFAHACELSPRPIFFIFEQINQGKIK